MPVTIVEIYFVVSKIHEVNIIDYLKLFTVCEGAPACWKVLLFF